MQTYANSVGKTNAFTLPLAIERFQRHDVPFDEVYIGKPWCGYDGLYQPALSSTLAKHPHGPACPGHLSRQGAGIVGPSRAMTDTLWRYVNVNAGWYYMDDKEIRPSGLRALSYDANPIAAGDGTIRRKNRVLIITSAAYPDRGLEAEFGHVPPAFLLVGLRSTRCDRHSDAGLSRHSTGAGYTKSK